MKDVGDEVPVFSCSSRAGPPQIGAVNDLQLLHSGEALYPLRQGFDAWAIHDHKLFEGGGEAA
jgi:hypothetical protein